MKHEIIKTDNYLLVVDESEIKEGDYGLGYSVGFQGVGKGNFIFKHKGSPSDKIYAISKGSKKIIAHLPLNGSPILEGLDLLPPLENEVDVEKMAFGQYGGGEDNRTIDAFIDGYTQALEDNKDKKYTEEDLRKAWNTAYIDAMSIDEETYKPLFYEDFIQSLSQLKMPIGFECEIEDKIALDGHTIIGTEPKTTTTPEGHTQWVGTYIY